MWPPETVQFAATTEISLRWYNKPMDACNRLSMKSCALIRMIELTGWE